MAHYFCDYVNGNVANSGVDMDNAKESMEDILDIIVPGSDDIIWVRRATVDITTGGITATGFVSGEIPLICAGWPRGTVAIASSDWTNGSTSVNVDDGGMTELAHVGRYITGPDSKVYQIAKVVDANTLTLLRPYNGTTASNSAATIHADELYDIANFSETFTADADTDLITISTSFPKEMHAFWGPFRLTTTDTLPAGLSTGTDYWLVRTSLTTAKLATSHANAVAGTTVNITDTGTGTHTIVHIDDSAWTIKKSAWNADAHSMHVISFEDLTTSVNLAATDSGVHYYNLKFQNSTYSPYGLLLMNAISTQFVGCVFSQDTTKPATYQSYGSPKYKRCVWYQSAASANLFMTTSIKPYFIDCIFRGGTYGANIDSCPSAIFENCNFGVEDACSTSDINFDAYSVTGEIKFRNCKFGQSAGLFNMTEAAGYQITSEDHNGVLGAFYYRDAAGTIESVTAGAGSPVPAQRTGGNSTLFAVYNTGNGTGGSWRGTRINRDLTPLKWNVVANGNATFTVYIQSPVLINAGNIRLFARYLSSKHSTSNYIYTETEVQGFCAARSGLTDWDNSISVSVSTVEASVVRLWLTIIQYDAANAFYVDPLLVVA